MIKLSGKDIEVSTKGVNGEITKDMLNRYKEHLNDENFDIVIIFGGANDVAYNKITVEEVLSNLFKMYEMSIEKKMKVVFITIPFAKYDISDNYPQNSNKKIEINQGILKKCKDLGIDCLDLMPVFPVKKMTEEELSLVFDDGLHFTPKGYDTIGEHLYEIIKKYL